MAAVSRATRPPYIAVAVELRGYRHLYFSVLRSVGWLLPILGLWILRYGYEVLRCCRSDLVRSYYSWRMRCCSGGAGAPRVFCWPFLVEKGKWHSAHINAMVCLHIRMPAQRLHIYKLDRFAKAAPMRKWHCTRQVQNKKFQDRQHCMFLHVFVVDMDLSVWLQFQGFCFCVCAPPPHDVLLIGLASARALCYRRGTVIASTMCETLAHDVSRMLSVAWAESCHRESRHLFDASHHMIGILY